MKGCWSVILFFFNSNPPETVAPSPPTSQYQTELHGARPPSPIEAQPVEAQEVEPYKPAGRGKTMASWRNPNSPAYVKNAPPPPAGSNCVVHPIDEKRFRREARERQQAQMNQDQQPNSDRNAQSQVFLPFLPPSPIFQIFSILSILYFSPQFSKNPGPIRVRVKLRPETATIVFYTLENPHVGEIPTSQFVHFRDKHPFKVHRLLAAQNIFDKNSIPNFSR